MNRRVITSCKRTVNLTNMTNLWKKVILEKMDKCVLEGSLDPPELVQQPAEPPISEMLPRSTVLSMDTESDEIESPHHWHDRSPKVSDAWRSGAPLWGAGRLY